MKLTYWNTSCFTYFIGMITGLFMSELDYWWILIPISLGAIVVSLYHYFILDENLEDSEVKKTE